MLWVRGLPLHEGHLFDLSLRDLLDLDLFLARCAGSPEYAGEVRHWWQIPAAVEDINELPEDCRPQHPDAMLLLAVRVWGSYRASGRTESFEVLLPDDLEWDEVLVVADPGDDEVEAEKLPRGFRAGNTQSVSMPDVEGMDLNREVNRRLLDVSRVYGFTRDEIMAHSLSAWLGIAASIDAIEVARRGR